MDMLSAREISETENGCPIISNVRLVFCIDRIVILLLFLVVVLFKLINQYYNSQ